MGWEWSNGAAGTAGPDKGREGRRGSHIRGFSANVAEPPDRRKSSGYSDCCFAGCAGAQDLKGLFVGLLLPGRKCSKRVSRVQILANFAHVGLLALIADGRIPSDDIYFPEAGEIGDDVLGDAVGEAACLRIAAYQLDDPPTVLRPTVDRSPRGEAS